MKDYKFKDIENYLKKDATIGKDILDAFESLSDAAIVFSPIVFGPQVTSLFQLLDVKDRLFQLGNKVIDYITKKEEADYISRTEQLRAAYALICYTSYFEALQKIIPKNTLKKLIVKFDKKVELRRENSGSSEFLEMASAMSDKLCITFYTDHVTSFSEIKRELLEVYSKATNNMLRLILAEHIFDEDKEEEKMALEEVTKELETIPKNALKIYEAQYLKLADEFEDFAYFAQLKNFEGLHYSIENNQSAINKIVTLTEEIDVGLKNLNGIVNSIVTNYHRIEAQDLIDDLRKKYQSMIEDSIIDDKEISSDRETISLRFPKIVDAFIPQSYKCFSYINKDIKLEDTTVWNHISIQSDLDKFFIKYLYSIDSINYPLIILGQPGSGKSLLTKVLSAQLMSNSYTVVRIPLREVNAEAGIDVLVEDQIRKLINRSLPQGYGGFAGQFNEKPLTIILDGYDELLQAKGDVFSGYLEKVRTFQQDQKAMNRPVRIIITSRVTLIDKARIPIHSTILRLMEFDVNQRKKWMDIWNHVNADYFEKNKIKPFEISIKDEKKESSLIELAEQPLLLLMLALYDSEANELSKMSDMKRTELYDNLLRRFVRRERRRYVVGFEDKSAVEQEKIIDQEMERLGIVAIGMYNREEVVILSSQLEKDLDIFKAHREDGSPKLNTLKESESVLGGFFFIHKSMAQDIEEHNDITESAYEFLHNTFGEFLTADFILRNTINEVCNIYIDRKFKSSSLTNRLTNTTSLDPNWFYCLMFVPLYSRPVVIEMLREHITKALEHKLRIHEFPMKITNTEFVENLQFLIQNQLDIILNTRNIPSVMQSDVTLDSNMPLIGYLSTYTLNLILLASTLSPEGFLFKEEQFCLSGFDVSQSRPWDKLTTLWKTWFAPADLMGLSVILKTRRKKDASILITCNGKFEATRYEQPIDILLCVSSTLADTLSTSLSGIHTSRFHEITKMSHREIHNMLKEENPNLYFSYLVTLLRNEINGLSGSRKPSTGPIVNYQKINDLIQEIFLKNEVDKVNCETLLNAFEILECCLRRKVVFLSNRKELLKVIPYMINYVVYDRRKINRYLSPEIISGARLLYLLIGEEFLLNLCNNQYYNDYEFYNSKWIEELRRTMQYVSRYPRMEIYFYGDLKEDSSYEPFEMIEGFRIFKHRHLEGRLLEKISSLDFEILVKIDPKLSSHLLLQVSRDKHVKKQELTSIIEEFLMRYLEQLELVGLEFIHPTSIINAIKLANYVNNHRFIMYIQKMLNSYLFRQNFGLRNFFRVCFIYPRFITELIHLIPEFFKVLLFEPIDTIFFERNFRYRNNKKLYEYMELLRSLNKLTSDIGLNSDQIIKMFRGFDRVISNHLTIEDLEIEQLTISQINILEWYASFTKSMESSLKIRKLLNQNSKITKYTRISNSERMETNLDNR